MQRKQGAVRAVALCAAIATSALFGAAAANAGGRDTINEVTGGGGPTFSVNATFASDYRYRGFTQTQEKATLQGGFDAAWPNFYAGLWASGVDFGEQFTGSGYRDAEGVEVVSYAGLRRKNFMFGYDVDLRTSYYAYPGMIGVYNTGSGTLKDLDYVEFMAAAGKEWMPGLRLDSRIFYSPDYQGGTGQNWVFESSVARKLPTVWSIAPTFSATLGSSYGEKSEGGLDYYYWNAGFSFVFADYFEFDLRYYDTFDVSQQDLGSSCSRLCDGRVVARITFEN